MRQDPAAIIIETARSEFPAWPARFTDCCVAPSVSISRVDPSYTPRQQLPGDTVFRAVSCDGYQPPWVGKPFEKPVHIASSYEDLVRIVETSGVPYNRLWRTGLVGRGRLYNWGPNHAADAILVRPDKDGVGWEALLIRRRDGVLAFPGGFLNKDEEPRDAACRELIEEAVGNDNVASEIFQSRANLIFQGYADDPRNTDNAWIETSAYLVTVSRHESEALFVRADDDATDAQWFRLNREVISSLFAGHPVMARLALLHLNLYGNGVQTA